MNAAKTNMTTNQLEKTMLNPYVTAASIAACFLFGTTCYPVLAQQKSDTVKVEITIKKDDDKKDDKKTDGKQPFTGTRPSVDVAILLDTSNSMDGLISQAKSQLWNIVQQFAEAKKNGQTPSLRVSVFEYGNTRLPASEGYIRQVCQLTDDLDVVSESLFSLKTSGGDEYCGMVIDEAYKRLDWSKEANAYKTIFIAGNEPFTQGSVDYKDSCRKAIESGIIVNTIHCGNRQTGINGEWANGAKIAEGEFLNIDQDRKVVHIECPQDKVIIELNTSLNKTYLWYGKERLRYFNNQKAQDSNASDESVQLLVQRAKTKGSKLYSNVGRDLVDSIKADKELLSKVKKEELPEELQKMTVEEQEAYIKKLSDKRADIQKKLAKLNREREAFLVKARKKMAEEKGEATLGDAVISAVNKQMKKSGFEVKDK